MPQVSIVTPCYNAEAFLAETLESVRAQNFTDWEQIIVDDGSVDASPTIAANASRRDPRVRLIRQENAGASAARNAGFAAASPESRYVYFLDADDRCKPGALQTLVSYLEQHANAGSVACDYDFIDAQGQPVTPQSHEYARIWRYAPHGQNGLRVLPDAEPNTPFAALYCWCRIIPSAWLLRRETFAATPGYCRELTIGHDVNLALHCALRSEVHWLSDALVDYRRHSGQKTARIESIRAEEQRLWEIWDRGEGLTPAQKQIVANAARFKKCCFEPYLWRQWGAGALQRGEWKAGAACFAQSWRKRLTAQTAGRR